MKDGSTPPNPLSKGDEGTRWHRVGGRPIIANDMVADNGVVDDHGGGDPVFGCGVVGARGVVGGEGHGRPPTTTIITASAPTRSFSVGGIYRRKHTLRAAFRCASFILLLGGYALRRHLGGGRGGAAPSSPGEGGLRSGGSPFLKNTLVSVTLEGGEGPVDDRDDQGGVNFSRLLEGDDGDEEEEEEEGRGHDGDGLFFAEDGGKRGVDVTSALDAAADDETSAQTAVKAAPLAAVDSLSTETESCPSLEKADPAWFAVFYAIGVLYMFLALAIVCDEFFVPALEEMSNEHHLNLSMDVAGATLMAAGGSAPELFTSFVGTFQQTDIGIGTIVGSAVFNVLFVIGMCSLLSREVLTLTWWPLFRDSFYYAVGLIVLSVLAGVVSANYVYWWEALILFAMYFGYVTLMYFNRKIYKKLTGKELVLGGEESNETAEEDNGARTNGAAETAGGEAAVASNGNGSTKAKAAGENGDGHLGPHSSDDFVDSSTNNRNSAGGGPATRQAADSPAIPGSGHPPAPNFRWPGTFRAGVLKLLLHPEGWEDKGGIGIVAKIQGDVDHVFKQIDINGDGTIDQDELGTLFTKLGHDLSEHELGEVFSNLDLDGNGTISEEEFAKWYVKSEERILSKVKPIFDQFDADKSGTIDRDELRNLLKTLEPHVSEEDVDDAIKAMYKDGSTEEITYDEFADWYVHSMIYTRKQAEIEKQMEEEAQGVCEALSPPKGEGCFAWFKYLLLLPLVAVLTFTVPDVRRPGYGKWCYLSFILSIAWIAGFSYFMVSWTTILGNTIGIPSVVMGYTVLAAGTSVPDLLSSVIVARMGEGDMAVSSSIGSNIFDILVGLPLPWLIFTLWPTTPDVVTIQAQGIWTSIFILIGMLVAIILIVHCQGWKMTRTVGGLMFVLYFAFLVQAIWIEYLNNPCFSY